MQYRKELRRLIDKSSLNVVDTAIKAGIGQSSLYEVLRGEYFLSSGKTIAVLKAIGAYTKNKEEVLRFREEELEGNLPPRPRRRSKGVILRDRDKISSFFKRHGMEVEDSVENPSLLVLQVANEGFPVLALGQVENWEVTFGNALKCMLQSKSKEILVVTFIVEVPPEWQDVENFGIHVMNPNDALEGLQRISEGQSLSKPEENTLYF
jgi:hypothetical protein